MRLRSQRSLGVYATPLDNARTGGSTLLGVRRLSAILQIVCQGNRDTHQGHHNNKPEPHHRNVSLYEIKQANFIDPFRRAARGEAPLTIRAEPEPHTLPRPR